MYAVYRFVTLERRNIARPVVVIRTFSSVLGSCGWPAPWGFRTGIFQCFFENCTSMLFYRTGGKIAPVMHRPAYFAAIRNFGKSRKRCIAVPLIFEPPDVPLFVNRNVRTSQCLVDRALRDALSSSIISGESGKKYLPINIPPF